MFLLVTYNVGYKSSKTIDSRVTTKFEIGGAAKALELGGSIEVSIGYSNTEENSTSTTLRDIYTIGPHRNFWICQRMVYLDTYKEKNAVWIWDTQLVVNGDMC